MNTSLSQPRPAQPFRIWHAVVIFLIANTISILPAGINGEEAFYNNFTRPAIAPPDWLFAPMWLFLNITSLVGLGLIANMTRSPQRQTFLLLEGIAWVLFAVFNTVYFGMKSPILGAIDTAFAMLLTAYSCWLAWQINRRAAAMIGLRLAWLLLATFVSAWVVFNNVDPWFARMNR